MRWWDFLFYLSFGLVITLAVETAGVLMVFAYLVAPAIIALASRDRWVGRLVTAWIVGLVGERRRSRGVLPLGPAERTGDRLLAGPATGAVWRSGAWCVGHGPPASVAVRVTRSGNLPTADPEAQLALG